MMRLVSDVAVLYVDPFGPYPKLVEHWWDEKRDARNYAGPWPVIAHPPCGPWGTLAWSCSRQDKSLGPIAVEQVRRFGGVLEHPAHSKLWDHCEMPAPYSLPDRFGGRTIAVDQVRWGHVAIKRTWLYLVGVAAAGPNPPPREATHTVTFSNRVNRERLPEMKKKDRHITPVDFARYLISLAQQVSPRV
jgi:hypothetical protein